MVNVTEERKQELLAAMPGTHEHLRTALGIGKDTLRLTLNALKSEGRCHIGAWEKRGNAVRGAKMLEVFHAGPGKDAPRAGGAAKSKQPKPEQVEKVVIRAARRDPLVEALFGPA